MPARQAWERGRLLLAKRTHGDTLAALAAFERAIAADPTYAPAWAGRGDAFALLYDYPRAKEAAVRALELDGSLAAAHATLGFVLLHGEWDWTGAGRALARALELDPAYPTALLWHALWLETQGRTEEAVAAARQAAQVEPGSLHARASLGYRLYWARRYEEAAATLRSVLAEEPRHATAGYFLGRTLVQQGKFDEAEVAFLDARLASPGDSNLASALAYLYARAGRRREALAALEPIRSLAERGLPFASQTAGILAGLGREADAIDWLERALATREGPLVWLAVDPRFDPLRGQRRFHAILQAMGLDGKAGAE